MARNYLDTPVSDSYLVDAPRAAAEIFGCSERTFHKLRQGHPDFPQPVILAKRTVRYRRAELLAFVELLAAESVALPEPRQLAASKRRRAADDGVAV